MFLFSINNKNKQLVIDILLSFRLFWVHCDRRLFSTVCLDLMGHTALESVRESGIKQSAMGIGAAVTVLGSA